MDNALDYMMREIAEHRDDRLRDAPMIPPRRLEALRDAVARIPAKNASAMSDPHRARWLARFQALLSPRVCITAAAACLLLLATLLRTATPAAPRDRTLTFNPIVTAVHAPMTAFEGDAPMLTLRVRRADPLQMPAGFLPRTALQNPRPSVELTMIRLDLSLDTAADQLH
jgi:hypothetical protein